MAFIEKKDPTILNIKLTSRGRDLLSQGNLNFTYFGVGDSEIDYNNLNYKPQILRAADKNPNILSFIPVVNTLNASVYNELIAKSPEEYLITNSINDIGFFDNNYILTGSSYTKQPNIQINIDEVVGGNTLHLYKSPTYISSSPEPAINDILMVKWVNKRGVDTNSSFIVNSTSPIPYLFYKITGITSGSLATNNLIITVDRSIPNFSSVSGSTGVIVGAVLYANTLSTDTILGSSEYLIESISDFINNSQCNTTQIPFWNLSIVYAEEIIGVNSGNTKYINFATSGLTGFVSYIQEQAPINKKLGIIHYSNSFPQNTYGEGLYSNTPILNLPTIMWHKSNMPTLGLILSGNSTQKLISKLNLVYFDLVDNIGNVVGKIFNDLKLFVIEDQDLLYAISFKSNRNWTLPQINISIGNNNDFCSAPTTTTTTTI